MAVKAVRCVNELLLRSTASGISMRFHKALML